MSDRSFGSDPQSSMKFGSDRGGLGLDRKGERASREIEPGQVVEQLGAGRVGDDDGLPGSRACVLRH